MLLAAGVFHAFIHEVMGHGFFSILVGQKLEGFYLSPFGASYSYITFSNVPSLVVLQAAGGTISSVLFGILLLMLVYPRMKKRGSSFQAKLFVLLFILMLETDILYAFISPIFSFGDSYEIARVLSIYPPTIMLAMIPIVFIIYHPILREYLELLAPFSGGGIGSHGTQFKFLLKVTYVPIILLLTTQFIVVGVFSGLRITTFFLEGEIVMSALLIPVIYLVSQHHDPVNRGEIQKTATAEEARSALGGLITLSIVSLSIIAINVAIFGPTAESGTCCQLANITSSFQEF